MSSSAKRTPPTVPPVVELNRMVVWGLPPLTTIGVDVVLEPPSLSVTVSAAVKVPAVE